METAEGRGRGKEERGKRDSGGGAVPPKTAPKTMDVAPSLQGSKCYRDLRGGLSPPSPPLGSATVSGDPAAVMKMAVLLFVMAKCGSSITIWTFSKLMFVGVFTVPKIYTSYTTQLLKFGKFWRKRLTDGWESCTHKKAVVAAIFTLIWSISSTATRIWAVFMLAVALKLYQQRLSDDRSNQEAEVMAEGVAMAQEEAPKPGHHRYIRESVRSRS